MALGQMYHTNMGCSNPSDQCRNSMLLETAKSCGKLQMEFPNAYHSHLGFLKQSLRHSRLLEIVLV